MLDRWPFHWPLLFVPQFRGPMKHGHEFCLMVDGDEFCLRLGESGGRVHLDNILADCFSQRLRRHLWKSSWRAWAHDEAMYADKRLTSRLIGVFDAGTCGLVHDLFCACVA